MKFKQARKFKANHGSVTGYYPFCGELIPYESTLERDFIIRESFFVNTKTISAQPVTIEFQKNGRTHPYTPDFFVAYQTPNAYGRTGMFVEVKPKSEWRIHHKQWLCKWAAMKAFATKLNCSFRIYDEDRIRDFTLANINQLLRFKSMHVEPFMLEKVTRITSQAHAISINDLACSLEGSLHALHTGEAGTKFDVYRIIWHALANRILDCDIANYDVMHGETKVWLAK